MNKPNTRWLPVDGNRIPIEEQRPKEYNSIRRMTGHSLLIVGQFHDNFSATIHISRGRTTATTYTSDAADVKAKSLRHCAFVSYIFCIYLGGQAAGQLDFLVGALVDGPSMSCIQLWVTHKDSGARICRYCCAGHWQILRHIRSFRPKGNICLSSEWHFWPGLKAVEYKSQTPAG